MRMTALALAISLAGCQNTMTVLEGADYVCVEGQLDGPYTDSNASGRGIKLPEGETLTPATIEALYP